MKTITEAVSRLTPEELRQAAYLYQKLRKDSNRVIPEPSTGTVRQDGTARRFIYQSTRHESVGETHIYIDKLLKKTFEITYQKDGVTGLIKRIKKYL